MAHLTAQSSSCYSLRSESVPETHSPPVLDYLQLALKAVPNSRAVTPDLPEQQELSRVAGRRETDCAHADHGLALDQSDLGWPVTWVKVGETSVGKHDEANLRGLEKASRDRNPATLGRLGLTSATALARRDYH